MFQTRAEFFMDHVIGEHRNFSEVCTPFAALSFHQLFFVRMISQKSAHLFYCSEREMSREQTLNFFFIGCVFFSLQEYFNDSLPPSPYHQPDFE
eukprot:c23729_g1_i1.p1 GENE.c23729_g1_i1~~c23729_g1_i1.p1  ORF type:complete len:105 (-),score=4.09 c23729_g1_i1:361-642(-)